MKYLTLFCLMMFINIIYQAQEIYNVETIPTLRTKAYSSGAYKNIVIFSAPRTGSSLVYNIFKFLFEENPYLFEHHFDFNLNRVVLKTHDFVKLDFMNKKNTLCVFTFRNPIEAIVSIFRIQNNQSINLKEFAQNRIDRHHNHLLISEKIEKEGQGILRLKYEDFVNNFDYIFDIIENHFEISIDSKDKELMRLSYSKENIQTCTKNLKNFHNYLPFSGFHGQHVGSQKYTPPADLLYWLNIYLQDVKPLFQTYGYFLDSSI